MKKLKVILPAILTLAVSTSAAVTGTVAWFTASRLQTVKMTGITAVNPESGLNLNKVENVANTKVDFDKTGTPNKYTITHGKVLKKGGNPNDVEDWNTVYLRDASIDMSAPTVWAANVNDSGTVTGYLPQSGTFSDKDGKTFNGNGVVYATAYSLNFSPTTLDSKFNYSLFLDIKSSSFTVDNGAKPEANENLNKALRVGFKQGTSFFVWAPFADYHYRALDVDASNFATEKTKLYTKSGDEYTLTTDEKFNTTHIYYREFEHYSYVFDTLIGNTYNYNDTGKTKLLVGNAEANDGDAAPAENKTSGVVDKTSDDKNNAGDRYIGYLGILDKLYDTESLETNPGTTVQVYTWFEGTDPNCVADEFGGSLDNITSTLNFVMRRTEKNNA